MPRDADFDALAALELRLRPGELPDGPAPLADFHRPLRAAPGDDDDDDLILLQTAALADGALLVAPHDLGARVIPLFDASTAPIPIPTPEPAEPALPLADWALADALRGHVAIARRRPGEAALRGLSVAAITLPLFLPVGAAASPAPAVQRPSAPAAASASRAEPEDMPLEPAAPADPEAEAAPAAEPEPAPAPASPPAGGVPDAFWAAMKGQDVVLILDSGRRRGRLVASDADSILFVDYVDDGRLRVLPKSAILELRGAPPSSTGRGPVLMGPPEGNGRIGAGIAMTVVGTPLLLTGIIFLAACPSCASISLPTFLPGAALVGAGIPLIVRGTKMRRAWYARQNEALARVRPGFAVGPRGWSGGLTLRF